MGFKIMGAATYRRFNVLCDRAVARGRRLELQDIDAAAALARELGREAPAPERVAALAARLGLAPEDVPKRVAPWPPSGP